MNERIRGLDLIELLEKYPPREEIFADKDGGEITALVSRNGEGRIVYVKPGSTRYVNSEK